MPATLAPGLTRPGDLGNEAPSEAAIEAIPGDRVPAPTNQRAETAGGRFDLQEEAASESGALPAPPDNPARDRCWHEAITWRASHAATEPATKRWRGLRPQTTAFP